ncbi:MAG: RDD family protein [Chloroflexota bacterium]
MAVQPPPQQPYYAQQPAGPAPGVRYASAGQRLIAYIIDAFIIGFVVGIFYMIGIVVIAGGASVNENTGTVTTGPGAGLGMIILLIGFLVGFLWKPFWWSRGGQTPAYKILGMRVVRARDGGPVSFGTGILRIIGYAVSGFILYLGFIWILFDAQKQGWHDKIASTVVIQA